MGIAHSQVSLISSIVWTHRFRPSPSWLVVTAVGRNCYSPVNVVIQWADSAKLTETETTKDILQECPEITNITTTCQYENINHNDMKLPKKPRPRRREITEIRNIKHWASPPRVNHCNDLVKCIITNAFDGLTFEWCNTSAVSGCAMA